MSDDDVALSAEMEAWLASADDPDDLDDLEVCAWCTDVECDGVACIAALDPDDSDDHATINRLHDVIRRGRRAMGLGPVQASPMMTVPCGACEGSGMVPEYHGQGITEMLGCPACQATGKVTIPLARVELNGHDITDSVSNVEFGVTDLWVVELQGMVGGGTYEWRRPRWARKPVTRAEAEAAVLRGRLDNPGHEHRIRCRPLRPDEVTSE
jgi:hypothetical protein